MSEVDKLQRESEAIAKSVAVKRIMLDDQTKRFEVGELHISKYAFEVLQGSGQIDNIRAMIDGHCTGLRASDPSDVYSNLLSIGHGIGIVCSPFIVALETDPPGRNRTLLIVTKVSQNLTLIIGEEEYTNFVREEDEEPEPIESVRIE